MRDDVVRKLHGSDEIFYGRPEGLVFLGQAQVCDQRFPDRSRCFVLTYHRRYTRFIAVPIIIIVIVVVITV